MTFWDRKAEDSSYKVREERKKKQFLRGPKAPWYCKILFGPIRFYRPDCSNLATMTERLKAVEHFCGAPVENRTWEDRSDSKHDLVQRGHKACRVWHLCEERVVVKCRRRCNVLRARSGLTVPQLAGILCYISPHTMSWCRWTTWCSVIGENYFWQMVL